MSVVIIISNVLIVSYALGATHVCREEYGGDPYDICYGTFVTFVFVSGGPLIHALGYLFLLFERRVMEKRYGKVEYVFRPHTHPSVTGKTEQI